MDKFLEFWNGLGGSHQVMIVVGFAGMVLVFVFALILLYGGKDETSDTKS